MIVVVASLVVGLLLIGLIARFAGNVPRFDSRTSEGKPDDRPVIGAQEFDETIRSLLEAIGLDIGSVSTDENGVLEMTCRDPRPVIGGRLLVRVSRLTDGGQVDAAEVLAFAESVRGDMGALKGIDIAVSGFTDEALAAVGAAPAPVELIDAPKLVDLVREFLPERAEILERYRWFSTVSPRHSRPARPSGIGDAPDLLPH